MVDPAELTYNQPVGHGRQMKWTVAPNELGTAATHLDTEEMAHS